jgi:hypothetical protein
VPAGNDILAHFDEMPKHVILLPLSVATLQMEVRIITCVEEFAVSTDVSTLGLLITQLCADLDESIHEPRVFRASASAV